MHPGWIPVQWDAVGLFSAAWPRQTGLCGPDICSIVIFLITSDWTDDVVYYYDFMTGYPVGDVGT